MPKKKKTPNHSNGSAKGTKANALKSVVRSKIRHLETTEKAVFANHVIVRAEPNTVQLYFFDAQPPLVLDSDSEEAKQAAAKKDHVDARCVCRVVLPSYVMPGLINALTENSQKHTALMAALEEAFAARQEDQQ